MSSQLKTDICDLALPGTSVKDVEQTVIDEHISPELRYACRYWAGHNPETKEFPCEEHVSRFLKEHLLHWIEVCCLLEIIQELVTTMQILKRLYSVSVFALICCLFMVLN